MRIESSVTSVSWIPSEAVTGPVLKGTFESGFTSYDDPPPDMIDDLEEMREQGSFRFANHLAAWIDVKAGKIVDAGYAGGGLMGRTTVRLAGLRTTFNPVPLADIRHEPEVSDSAARFVQTTGGRTGLPAPRRVKHPPFVQFKAPTVWTTLALTIRADGTSESTVIGASKFPRHWVYDDEGALTAKVGLADFKDWYRDAFGKHTPWGERDSAALVTAVESALERELSTVIMRGDAKPEIRAVKKGMSSSSRVTPERSCSCCSTACSPSSSTVSPSPSWVPARSSASAPSSRAGSAPRPSGRRHRAALPSRRRTRSTGSRSRELAEGHRREG